MYKHIEKDEKKLTDEEIVKALECCANFSTQKDCDLCPIGVIKCFEQENLMPQLALDLINRLQAENAELQKQVDVLKFDKEILQKLIDKREKDTAKEIYAQVLEWSPVGENYHWFITTLENWLKERYGVEVE